jgi:hypothetical protein
MQGHPVQLTIKLIKTMANSPKIADTTAQTNEDYVIADAIDVPTIIESTPTVETALPDGMIRLTEDKLIGAFQVSERTFRHKETKKDGTKNKLAGEQYWLVSYSASPGAVARTFAVDSEKFVKAIELSDLHEVVLEEQENGGVKYLRLKSFFTESQHLNMLNLQDRSAEIKERMAERKATSAFRLKAIQSIDLSAEASPASESLMKALMQGV